MKTILKLLFIFQIFTLTTKSYAVPMSGDYTIGASGNFTTIGDAIGAVTSQGVSGPVTFKIFSGTYHETTPMLPIPNVSAGRIVTFESMAGNPDSVIIRGLGPSNVSFSILGAAFMLFQNLTLQDILIAGACSDIVISSNKFLSEPGDVGIQMASGNITNLDVTNNINLTGISNDPSFGITGMTISINSFAQNSVVSMHAANDLSIYINTGIGRLKVENSNNVVLSANKLNAVNPGSYPLQILATSKVKIMNNFISNAPGISTALFRDNNSVQCVNNTFSSAGFDTTLICINNDTLLLRNNIYDNDSGGYSLSYAGNTALTSDYNTYNNGGASDLISYDGSAYTLASFQTQTGQDLHSVLKNVAFASATDLHLNPVHIGDEDFIGTPDPLALVDIDGQPRNPLYPYKGADELDFALPVELSSFTASVTGNNVLLLWTTSSENNNSGFEIEQSDVKRQMSDEWIEVGSVNGNGTTNSMHQYNFVDMNLLPGKYKYRLKQTDYNGNFKYYNLSNEVVIGVPAEFHLGQNYPNPFNPETNIVFDIPSEQFVKLKIYDVSGRLITQLINEVKTAGRYTAKFNASNVSSGIYFYEITAGDFSDTKKMIIQK